jgi:hypothetical protein
MSSRFNTVLSLRIFIKILLTMDSPFASILG